MTTIAATCMRRLRPAISPNGILRFRCLIRLWPTVCPTMCLDPTKIIPEDIVPLRVIGRMVLDRNPDNHFAENEQVAFLPSNIVPGIDFSDDPLLQGRLFSYLDTQKSRLGTTNFPPDPDQCAEMPLCQYDARRVDANRRAKGPRDLRA